MKKFIALVVVLCVVIISSPASASDWGWIYSNDYLTIYVDNSSLRRDYNYRGYVFRVFIKFLYSDKGRKKEIEYYRSNKKPLPREIYNLSYDIYLAYFKEENGIKYCDFVNRTSYTNNGENILDRNYSHDYPRWYIITPDSVGEVIFGAVHAKVPN